MTVRIAYLDWHDTRLVVGGTIVREGATSATPVVSLLGRAGELIAYGTAHLAPASGTEAAAPFAALLELEAGEREGAATLTIDGEAPVAIETVESASGFGRIAAIEGGAVSGWAFLPADQAQALRLVDASGAATDTQVAALPHALSAFRFADVNAFGFAATVGDAGDLRLVADALELDRAGPSVPAATEPKAPAPAAGAWSADEDADAAPPVAAPPAFPPAPPGVEGNFDTVEDGGWAAGWALRTDRSAKVELEVLVDGVVVGVTVADQFREDLYEHGFSDPNCAFWFGLPDAALDGQEHVVAVRYAGTGIPLAGSPRVFVQPSTVVAQPAAAATYNIIPNAGFLEWPAGLLARPRGRFDEPLAGWFYDCRRGTAPEITLSVDRPGDLALRGDEYALRVSVEEGGTDGFMRLIVPLGVAMETLGDYRLSIGLRRPVGAADDALHIAEIFVGAIAGNAVDRVATIRRGLKPRGTQRLAGLRAPIDAPVLAAVAANAHPALVIEFRGNGTLLLFSPVLALHAAGSEATREVEGEFEDANIREQVGNLVLSPIWQPRARGMPGIRPPAAPAPAALARPPRGAEAMPFIPIVVPVFNAAIDVEELLRSIVIETDSPFEVVIFDDGSEDYAASRIARWEAIDPRIRYHRQRENVGYTRNINVALQSTVSEFVVLINSDTIVTPGWLRKLYQTVSVDETTAAAGPLSNAASWQSVPRTKSAQGDWVVNAFPDTVAPAAIAAMVERLSDGSMPTFPLLNGFCTLFRRVALEAVGWFDDASFPKGYGEENDLCLRLGAAGWRLRVATDAYVHHKKSKSFGNAQRKELSKQSNAVLRGKHPEVSFAEVEEQMRIEPAVNRIRQGLAHALGIEPVPHPPEDVAA